MKLLPKQLISVKTVHMRLSNALLYTWGTEWSCSTNSIERNTVILNKEAHSHDFDRRTAISAELPEKILTFGVVEAPNVKGARFVAKRF